MAMPVECKFLDDLLALCAQRVDVRALLGEFADNNRVLATFEIDDRATASAGHVVVNGKPSDGLLSAMATLTANGVADGCRGTHDRISLEALSHSGLALSR